MCYHVLVGVPKWYAGEVRSPRDFDVREHQNACVADAFGPSFATFSVSVAGCACSMYVEPSVRVTTVDAERKRRKWRRLGWSEAKIERTIFDAAAAAARAGTRAPGLWVAVATYIATIADAAGEVKLLIHRNSGSFAEEQFGWTGPLIIDSESLRDQYPFATDTVYVVRTWAA